MATLLPISSAATSPLSLTTPGNIPKETIASAPSVGENFSPAVESVLGADTNADINNDASLATVVEVQNAIDRDVVMIAQEEANAAVDVEAIQEDDDDTNLSSEDTMRRFLAFANRDRASGSSLPALLAHLNSAVEAADDADTEVTDLLVSGIAGALREERETKAAVARFLEEDIRNAVAPVKYDNNDPDQPTPKEYALRDRLQQLSAYKRTGKQRLDTTATQGMTLEKLVREKKVSKSLSRKLFKYICERDLHAECSRWGIPYPEPAVPNPVRADVVFSSTAGVVEIGQVGVKQPFWTLYED